MCGLTGLWRPDENSETSRRRVQGMLEKLIHRGPDSHGIWQQQQQGLCLGHRRLAIQDLSELGHQPMHSPSQRFSIVFNGEIYNFKDLTGQLETEGFQFNGHSDTEVVLAAFEHWGIADALQRFHGMFAIAVFDHQLQQLTLTRDRLGEKPLYFYQDQQGLVFASELSALLEGLEGKMDMDWQELSAYFRYCYFSPTATPFKQIQKLNPGHLLNITQQQLRQCRNSQQLAEFSQPYWDNLLAIDPNRQAQYKGLSDLEATDQFENLLATVVSNQSIADVDVGLFLSGGIDSSLVAAVLQHASDKPVQTYTIAFDNPAYNEAPFAADIAHHLGTTHTEIPLSMEECIGLIQGIDELVDEPFADPSIVPTYLVSREARKHVTVCLSGDGGDELFAGYNRYIWGNSVWNKMRSIPSLVRQGSSRMLSALPADSYDFVYRQLQKLNNHQGKKAEKDIGTKIHKLARLLRKDDAMSVYADLLSFWQTSPMHNTGASDLGYFNQVNADPFDHNFMQSAMLHDQRFYLACDNLFKVDRAAMANSLEVRLPLLDHGIVEFANNLPMKFKVRDNQSKWLMRELLFRYVPRELIERPKMGFSMPLNHWLRHDLQSTVSKLVNDQDLLHAAYLDPAKIKTVWSQHQTGRKDNNLQIWSVFMYLTWFKKYQSQINLSA